MSIGKVPVICDNCGKQRDNDTNHWWEIKAHDHVFEIESYKYPKEGLRHACGEECAAKLFQLFMIVVKREENDRRN